MRSHTWMSPVASHHRTHHFLETPTRSCCGLSSERADFSKEDEQRKAHKCSSFIPCPAWVNRPNSESLDPFSFKPMTTAPSLKSSLSLALFINLSVYSHGLGSGLEDTFADIWSHHTGLIFLACVTELWGYLTVHPMPSTWQWSGVFILSFIKSQCSLGAKDYFLLLSDLYPFLHLYLSCW